MKQRLRAAAPVVWAAGAVVLTGTVGYVLIEHARVFDALYMTVITVSTIGFREVFPLSTAGRTFTMLLAVAGVGIMLYAVSVVAAIIVETDLRRMFGLRKEHRMIDKLSNHMIVCGAGRTGHAILEILQSRREPFVAIEKDEESCRRLEASGVLAVHGDATHEDTLRAAGIERASTLIAALADDAHNVYTILLARQLNPSIRIIARAAEEESEDQLRLAGADKVVNPYRIGAMRIAYTALKPTVIDFLDASLPGTGGELELAEIKVDAKSRLAGGTLAGANVRQRFGIIVVALRRGEQSIFNPAPDIRIEPGDVLVALGPTEGVEKLEMASE